MSPVAYPRFPSVMLGSGVVLGVVACATYAAVGYHDWVLAVWVAALVVTGASCFAQRASLSRPSSCGLQDWCAIAVLLALFAPLYLARLDLIPFQINTDEITIMLVERGLVSQPYPDPLGLSSYFRFPSMVFLVFGWLGERMGGITLANMRAIHAVCGLAIMAASYALFRATMPLLEAAGGAIVVGCNHALLGISRMAMRDNTGLLIEAAALAVLLRGLQRRCPFQTYLGGVIAGLSWYTYYPSRMTMVVWLAALAVVAFVFRQPAQRILIGKLAAIAVLGFGLVAAPVICASLKQPSSARYAKEQLLLFPEGRQLQQRWISAKSVSEGVRTNILNGLTTFNNRVQDHGNIYRNVGHGFVDPLSGWLVWLGVLIVLWRLAAHKSEADVLAITGFMSLWLLLSFCVNKSPNYTRLLVVLPFVGYLVIEAVRRVAGWVSLGAQRLIGRMVPGLDRTIMVLAVLGIAQWNLLILSDFVAHGLVEGNDVGGTARYVETKARTIPYTYYLAASEAHPYYGWGAPYQWQSWLGFFASPKQTVSVLDPEHFLERIEHVPCSILMEQRLWREAEPALRRLDPGMTVRYITPDGSLLAVELQQLVR